MLPLVPIAVPEWHERAACAFLDPALWFPDVGVCNSEDQKLAKQLCEACEVRGDCLREVMEFEARLGTQYRHGIYAGYSPSERYALDKQMRGAA